MIFVLGALIPALANASQSYGSKLEDYIVSRNPKDTYDVEKLTREFEGKQKQGIV